METLYNKLLWFLGFKQGEHISDMLARQKQRFGGWWWTFPIVSILANLGLLALQIWLIWHIITYKEVED